MHNCVCLVRCSYAFIRAYSLWRFVARLIVKVSAYTSCALYYLSVRSRVFSFLLPLLLWLLLAGARLGWAAGQFTVPCCACLLTMTEEETTTGLMEEEHGFELWYGVVIAVAGIVAVSLTFISIMAICMRCRREEGSRYIHQAKGEMIIDK